MDKQIKKVEKEKERIEYIDNARGMLILLVVLGHVLLFTGAFEIVPYSFIMKMIYAFHMPAFLIISGILFDFDKWKKQSIFIFIKSRFIRFIVPYFIFEIIGALFHLIFNWGQIDSFIVAQLSRQKSEIFIMN